MIIYNIWPGLKFPMMIAVSLLLYTENSNLGAWASLSNFTEIHSLQHIHSFIQLFSFRIIGRCDFFPMLRSTFAYLGHADGQFKIHIQLWRLQMVAQLNQLDSIQYDSIQLISFQFIQFNWIPVTFLAPHFQEQCIKYKEEHILICTEAYHHHFLIFHG